MTDFYSSLRDRIAGNQNTGTVGIRNFDEAVFTTMGAVSSGTEYYLSIPNVASANAAGVQVMFADPEDGYEHRVLPIILIERLSMLPAMNRWEPGTIQYRAPASGSIALVNGSRTGFSAVEQRQQAIPHDIAYTLSVYARKRTPAQTMLDFIMQIYPPYGALFVKDSIGDVRSYEVFSDGAHVADELPGVTERHIGFTMNLRVEGELDTEGTQTFPTVQSVKTVVKPIG